MTERHTIFREPCLACDVCQARALSNLSRPNNVNLLVVAGFVVFKNYQNMPKFDPLFIFYPLYNKMAFSRTPIQKRVILGPPIQKIDTFETHYTIKTAFSRPPIQKTGIFETSIYNKMAFQRRTIQKSAIFVTPYKRKWPFTDPL